MLAVHGRSISFAILPRLSLAVQAVTVLAFLLVGTILNHVPIFIAFYQSGRGLQLVLQDPLSDLFGPCGLGQVSCSLTAAHSLRPDSQV